MVSSNQKTINNPIKLKGIGLHNGENVELTIKPAQENSGINFCRVDLHNSEIISANYKNVVEPILCTKIKNKEGTTVSTVEHLMAAFFGEGIDNALVEIDNEEVPILDGSSKEFIEKILSIGFEISNKPIKIIKINKKIEFNDGNRHISIEPSKLSLDIDFELKYENSLIGNQRNKVNVYEDDLNEIFNSRTFCLYEDIEAIKKIGLAKGGSLDNAVVVKNNEILNKEGLRNSREFVNHKILDCIGDLYTSGYRIIGNLKCSRGGHYLTNKLLKEVFSNNENFSIIEIQERNLPHTLINRSLLRSIA